MRRIHRLLICLTLAMTLRASAIPTLTTDKRRYDLGAAVVFRLRNDINQSLTWRSRSKRPLVWRIQEDGSEQLVWGKSGLGVLIEASLRPGETKIWIWDQPTYDLDIWRETNGEIAVKETIQGSYIARFDPNKQGWFPARFVIGSPTLVRPPGKAATTWATLRGIR